MISGHSSFCRSNSNVNIPNNQEQKNKINLNLNEILNNPLQEKESNDLYTYSF